MNRNYSPVIPAKAGIQVHKRTSCVLDPAVKPRDDEARVVTMNRFKDTIKTIDLTKITETEFPHRFVGAIILTHNNKFILQHIVDPRPFFPAGSLTTFGGKIEANETPEEALIRELKEELGATVNAADAIFLGTITEKATGYSELIYSFFWHDKQGTMTGCYEDELVYFGAIDEIVTNTHVTDDVCWMLYMCQQKHLLPPVDNDNNDYPLQIQLNKLFRLSKRQKTRKDLRNYTSTFMNKIEFRKLTNNDMPLFKEWATRPHVKNTWFQEGYETLDKYESKIAGNGYDYPFIIFLDDKPIGYIQASDLYAYRMICPTPTGLFTNEDAGTFCFDLFIGEEAYLNKGYGTKIVKSFVDKLLTELKAKKILIDPACSNKRAIRCYEKAGFKLIRQEHDGTEECCIMSLQAKEL